jgi:hypothetical protein
MRYNSLALAAIVLASAGCASIDQKDLVGTWSDHATVSLRLRSDGRGTINFGVRDARFVRWSLNTTNVLVQIMPKSDGRELKGLIDPDSGDLILLSGKSHVVWLRHIDTKEPPDYEKMVREELEKHPRHPDS